MFRRMRTAVLRGPLLLEKDRQPIGSHQRCLCKFEGKVLRGSLFFLFVSSFKKTMLINAKHCHHLCCRHSDPHTGYISDPLFPELGRPGVEEVGDRKA